MSATLQFDSDLIRRYERNGPRYTSYSTAPHFHSNLDVSAYRQAALLNNEQTTPLSIYVHVLVFGTWMILGTQFILAGAGDAHSSILPLALQHW